MKIQKLAIDLGTVNSLVLAQGRGIIVQEPTVVAYMKDSKKIIAVGSEAKKMIGKNPQNIIVKRPLRQGVIASYKLTEALLKRFINLSVGKFNIFKPEIMLSVPAGLTSVEERAVIKAARGAGGSKIALIPEPIAAAVGANMPINMSGGNMIINMGGGTVEVAVISMNGLVTFESKRVSGDAIDEIIKKYLKQKHNLLIGEQMAEKVKMTIGSAIDISDPKKMAVRGNDSISGQPTVVEISSNDLLESIKTVLQEMVVSIKKVIEKTPPELTSDIIERGIVLSGGTSLLYGIDKFFTNVLGVSCHVVENPLTSVVEGVNLILESPCEYEGSIKYET